MVIALLIILGLLVYMRIAVAVYFFSIKLKNPLGDNTFAALFWPFTLIYLLGVSLVKKIEAKQELEAKQKKEEEELLKGEGLL